MIVLGISGGFHRQGRDPSAVLVRDGEIVAAIAEERLSGVKFSCGRFPAKAIRAVLDMAAVPLQAVDVVAIGQSPHSDEREDIRDFLMLFFGCCPKICVYDRHLCFAASAFYASGYKRSKIITYDSAEEGTSTALWAAEENRITPVVKADAPNSLGTYYSMITQYLGFERDADEYKVMGLAAYGQPSFDMTWLLDETPEFYQLNSSCLMRGKECLFSNELEQRLPVPPRRREPINEQHMSIASSCQARLEDVVLGVLKKYTDRGDRLCISGSVGLNCSLNGTLARSGHFSDVFVQPAAGDDGLSLGAAYLASIEVGAVLKSMSSAFLGTSFSMDAIKYWLDVFQAPYTEVDDPALAAAEMLAQGKIVGWFNGRMEFGPRALGARSILADPRCEKMKTEINRSVKFREDFRPFAPSVLAETACRYFNLQSESPYMTMTVPVTSEGAQVLPATTHVNASARVQTVDPVRAPTYHRLISRFSDITGGCSAVLNTSLNVMGQPLSCAPVDAMRVFSCSGMDALVLENYVLRKQNSKSRHNRF